MTQIYMLHGVHAVQQSDWSTWLSSALQAQQLEAHCIHLPQAEQPDFATWQAILCNTLRSIDSDSMLIADDAACLALLHYLSQSRQHIGSLLLIAPFIQNLATRPELTQFIAAAQLNLEQLRLQAEKRVLFFSSNDPLVPPPFSLKLAPLLNMQRYEIKNAGHFSAQSDSNSFAPLLQAVLKMVGAQV